MSNGFLKRKSKQRSNGLKPISIRGFKNYKDVTYQTFKDPKFRKLLDGRFGADAVERVFSEHDAGQKDASKPVFRVERKMTSTSQNVCRRK